MKNTGILHRICALVWLLLLIPASLWWQHSIAFVMVASIWVNATNHWIAAQATSERELLQRLARIEEELVMIKNSRRRGA